MISYLLEKVLKIPLHFKTLFVLCWVKISPPKTQFKNATLIGENYGKILKDNGYFFFLYAKKNPNAFLVASKQSIKKNIELQHPQIVTYGSIKHIQVLIQSSKLFFSHSPRDIIYPYFIPLLLRKKLLVFIQHGVFGLKKTNKDQIKFLSYTDIVVASSHKDQ